MSKQLIQVVLDVEVDVDGYQEAYDVVPHGEPLSEVQEFVRDVAQEVTSERLTAQGWGAKVVGARAQSEGSTAFTKTESISLSRAFSAMPYGAGIGQQGGFPDARSVLLVLGELRERLAGVAESATRDSQELMQLRSDIAATRRVLSYPNQGFAEAVSAANTVNQYVGRRVRAYADGKEIVGTVEGGAWSPSHGQVQFDIRVDGEVRLTSVVRSEIAEVL